MALLARTRQLKHKFHHLISKEFKRCYIAEHGQIATIPYSSRTIIPAVNNPRFLPESRQLEYLSQIRFYAAPVQANQKKEERDSSGPRLNEQITDQSIRLVTDEGHTIISRYEALARARSLKMDLVEVDRNAKPCVCKIMDYHKERYLQQTKEKERSKSKLQLKKGPCKEVRFTARIKQNDLQMKADMAKRLMESGHRVKCMAIEPTGDLDLETLLSRFSALIEDVAIEESGPQVENKQAYVVVRHVKFGPSKKGSGKKEIKSSKNQPLEGNGDSVVEEELSNQDVQTKWAVSHGDDDVDTVFDLGDEVNGLPTSLKHEESTVVAGPLPASANRNLKHVEADPATVASSVQMGLSKHVAGNRYARDPRAGIPSSVPTDRNGRSARKMVNSVPQIPNQGRQLRFDNPSSQDSSHSGIHNSPAKIYGSFGARQTNSTTQQNAPAESNRYTKKDPSDSARSSGTSGAPPQRTPPAVDNRRIDRRLGVDNPGQGRWGKFRMDNSNGVPNKKSENQEGTQRG